MPSLIYPFRAGCRPSVLPIHRAWPYVWRRPPSQPTPSPLRLIWPYRSWRHLALTPVPTLPLDLFDAAVAWLRLKIPSSFPGGFHHGYRRSATTQTYAVLTDYEGDRQYSSERSFRAEGTLQITAIATERDTAVAAMNAVLAALENAPLQVQGCVPMFIGAGSRRNVRDDDLGVNDDSMIRESRAFPYMYSGMRTGPY